MLLARWSGWVLAHRCLPYRCQTQAKPAGALLVGFKLVLDQHHKCVSAADEVRRREFDQRGGLHFGAAESPVEAFVLEVVVEVRQRELIAFPEMEILGAAGV